MSILDTIVADKKKDLQEAMQKTPLRDVISESSKAAGRDSLIQSIRISGQLSIIAEMKKKSPSAGTILGKYSPENLAQTYETAGAKGISVLTERNYFEGSLHHLREAKKGSSLPILRKDFLFDPYQVYESKVWGASAILLIAAVLGKNDLRTLIRLCREVQIEALVEIHDQEELEWAMEEKPAMIGINNRNLKDLSIHLDTTFKLLEKIPPGTCTVSESGIASPEAIMKLHEAGVHAALIGESILKSSNLSETLRSFVQAGRSY